MAHVYQMQPIPGVDDLFTLINFLGDADSYKARLADMLALRDEINGLVEKAGKADQIEVLYGQAKTERETAAREYEQSKERAKQAMDEVDKAAKARQAAYDKQRAVAEADLAKRLAEVNDHSKRNAEQWVKIAEAMTQSERQTKPKLTTTLQRWM